MLGRQEKLLQRIIQEYIKTAEPIGSLKLARELGLSSATIRNEMAELEEAGFIFQPHTSAGRVPTAKAYLFYIEHFVKNAVLGDDIQKVLEVALKEMRGERAIKNLAKTTAELSVEAVIVAFDPHNLYFTGLSNLFAQPEFINQVTITSVSQVLDKSEEVMPEVLSLIGREQNVLIGEKNPFGNQCSFIAAPFGAEGLFGILGPMRMDYEKNIGLINYVSKLVTCNS